MALSKKTIETEGYCSSDRCLQIDLFGICPSLPLTLCPEFHCSSAGGINTSQWAHSLIQPFLSLSFKDSGKDWDFLHSLLHFYDSALFTMITGFSKAVILYLTPLLALAAILLSLFSFLAPSFLLNNKVALLTVTPSEVLLQNTAGKDIDGPSVFMGVLGGSYFEAFPRFGDAYNPTRLLLSPEE
jgi:hypothetical protein